jgi:hypothetical protein
MNFKVHATNSHADAPLKVPGLLAVQPNRDVGRAPAGLQAGGAARRPPAKEAPPLNKGFPLLLHPVVESTSPSCYPIATNEAGTSAFAASFAL